MRTASTRRPHIPAFDGVRGLLSVSVALGHIVRATAWAPRHEPLRALRFSTYFSIDFLFLLGAFSALLPVAVSGRMFPARSYALRRAGRILPVYYLTIVAAVALGGLLRPVTHTPAPHGAVAVLAHLAFVGEEAFPLRTGFGVQGIVWTMSIVAVFYVLFPLLARRWVRHPLLWLVGGVAFGVVWREVTRAHPDWYLQFPLFGVDFALGMTAACVYARMCRRSRDPSRAAALVSAGAVLALVVLLYPAGLGVARGAPLFWESLTLAVAVPLSSPSCCCRFRSRRRPFSGRSRTGSSGSSAKSPTPCSCSTSSSSGWCSASSTFRATARSRRRSSSRPSCCRSR